MRASFSKNAQQGRNALIKTFNPKLKGKLRYENGGTVKEIDCIPEKIPVISSSTLATVPYSINLHAANPYWRDVVTTRNDIASWHGAFGFPLEILEEGIEMGYREDSLFANIFNGGDVPCGMVVQFKANATVENPSLFNVNTREHLKNKQDTGSGRDYHRQHAILEQARNA